MPTSSVTWPLLWPPHIVHHHGHVACPTAATRIPCPPSAARIGHVTTRSTSPQHLRSPILTFATKKLSTGANGQKEGAASFFCPRSFDRAVMAKAQGTSCTGPGRGPGRPAVPGPAGCWAAVFEIRLLGRFKLPRRRRGCGPRPPPPWLSDSESIRPRHGRAPVRRQPVPDISSLNSLRVLEGPAT